MPMNKKIIWIKSIQLKHRLFAGKSFFFKVVSLKSKLFFDD